MFPRSGYSTGNGYAMKNSKPILDVKDLCKFFPIKSQGFFRKTIGWIRATDHVSFKLYRNEILGLVGESGCGKSTTTRTVLRALEPTSGSILFQTPEGRVDLANLTDRELRPIRKYMQMIFQDPFSSLNPRMTVGEIVSEPLKIHNLAQGTEISRRVDEMLLKVGLKPEHKQRYPHAFSGGQRQRIGIARALIMRPQFVVADEAVSA
ncbi:MAG: ABC transporter ATP-binding protein, partial [Lentisphaerae bacterium]